MAGGWKMRMMMMATASPEASHLGSLSLWGPWCPSKPSTRRKQKSRWNNTAERRNTLGLHEVYQTPPPSGLVLTQLLLPKCSERAPPALCLSCIFGYSVNSQIIFHQPHSHLRLIWLFLTINQRFIQQIHEWELISLCTLKARRVDFTWALFFPSG